MFLKLNGVELQASAGERWLDLTQKLKQGVRGALGVTVGGETFSLAESVKEYARARLLTYADEEGRRIYERSLQLLFLAAVARVCPGARTRFEHSLGQGLFLWVDWPGDTPLWKEVEARMRQLVDMNLPIDVRSLTTRDAARYFCDTRQYDRLRLLKHRRFDRFTLYRLDGCEDYFYGKMVPSTACLPAFALVPYAGGAVLMMPDPKDPTRPAAFVPQPKMMQVYSESARWSEILGCQNASDLIEMAESGGLREFIRVNEALQEHRIAEIAGQFAQSGARVVLIAGPSSSGKTTFAHRLAIALKVLGLKPQKLSLDDYYRNRATLPREADGSIDLERMDTLDIALLNEHLPRLLAGETVELPEYDFTTGNRTAHTHPMQLAEGQPLIIEGIHALNDALTVSVPRESKFKIYVSALTMLNLDDHNRIRTTDARLLRRIVRDNLFRGTPPEGTMAMWESVRHGEDHYIFPFQEEADALFNSALNYELPVLKRHAWAQLKAVQPDSPYFTLAGRLIKFLNYIPDVDVEDEVPLNSILREFIGGCCFYREK